MWLAWTYLPRFLGGGSGSKSKELQPLGPESACNGQLPCAPTERAAETICELQGVRYRAQFSSRGASLKHFWVQGPRYLIDGQPIDLVTAPGFEQRRPLRFDWRSAGADSQVKYDAFDWVMEQQDSGSCTFSYGDDKTQIRKVIRATQRPFEVEIDASIKNVTNERLTHRLAVEADSWRMQSEVESHLGRQSPYVTDVACRQDNKVKRLTPSDFEPGDFSDPAYKNGWFTQSGSVEFAAVSNFYFSQALVPLSPTAADCVLQIEERWDSDRFADKTQDPRFGAMYRARIGFGVRALDPGESASYRVLAFLGPKERDVLAAAVDGQRHLGELVDLGTFSLIAKYLLRFLVWLHSWIGNWGIAIIGLTVSVRTVLFPLTWKQIKSGLAMRRLKPEIDAITQKFKNDPQQKNLATMELWKKNKVNPLGGCLPALFQLPVWFALYTSLQTAVELYHTPFLWFRDLSAPDPFYVLPVVLGGTMILQQRLMPQQLDPMQQKMMTYVMPLVFTVMMLFLPSGLAVYMLTNAVLGILQQVVIEKYWATAGPSTPLVASTGIVVKEKAVTGAALTGGKKGNGPIQRTRSGA